MFQGMIDISLDQIYTMIKSIEVREKHLAGQAMKPFLWGAFCASFEDDMDKGDDLFCCNEEEKTDV